MKRYRKILESSGVSEAFQKKIFENFNCRRDPILVKAKKSAVDYAENFDGIRTTKHNSIAFVGQVGAGKTHLAAAISNYLMQSGVGVLYANYRDIITYLKQNLMDEENYQREINKYKRAAVLFIDDLFKGKREKDDNIIYEIVNHRYFAGLPMIITTEFDFDKWIDFDEAIGSRLTEICEGRVVNLEGADNYRLVG
ncbi:MAG TPA: ATP-binding protein [Negativicutes bacterium]|nr:ATP-binding protein [Negativicutes bacterium]